MHSDENAKVAQAKAKMIAAGLSVPNTIDVFDKPAGERCPHQRRTGCAVYERRPFGCRSWTCRWLVNKDTADLSRPDRSHYVIDTMPDHIMSRDRATGEERAIEVVTIWCDPKYPNAHRDPCLRAFLERRGREGVAALVRYSLQDGLVIMPPAISDDGKWHELRGEASERQSDTLETIKALGRAGVKVGTA